jgi:hypothetical protein
MREAMKRAFIVVLLAVGLSLPAFADTGIIGRTKLISSAQTVTATAYEALDLVGAKITLTDAARPETGTGIIQNVIITDLAAQSGSYDVVFFNADPSATTFTDEAALDIADADLTKIVCVVPVTSTAVANDNGVSFANNVGCAFALANLAGEDLYAAIIARSTPTFAGTSDVTLKVTIFQD